MLDDSSGAADAEITLAHAGLRLKVSPYGASLRGLWREGADGQLEEIVTSYTGAAGKLGGQGDVLIPFPSRIAKGHYTFEAKEYDLPVNDKDGPNAIHGFLRFVTFRIVEQSDRAITFVAELKPDEHPGYPFSLEATIVYALNDCGMTCRFSIRNTGEGAAPVAAGFHPYFTVGSDFIDADLVHVPFAGILEFENLIPTGRILPVEGTPFDFRAPRLIGNTVFNTCYVNPMRGSSTPESRLHVRLATADGSRAVTVWMDTAIDYVVLYSGDPMPEPHRRRSLAIEPMTCATDAFNHPEWGLTVLPAGDTFDGSWGVSPT